MLSASLLSLSLLAGQPEYKSLPVPAQAVMATRKDAGTLDDSDAIYQRYLWFRETDKVKRKEDMQGALLTVNLTSQLGCDPYGWLTHARPVQISDHILRIDLRYLAESVEGLRDVLRVWEEYQYDPAFSTLLTKDTLQLTVFEPGKEPKIKRARKTPIKSNWRIVDQDKQFDQGGRKVWGRWEWDTTWKEEVVEVSIKSLVDVDVIRFNGEHLDQGPMLELQERLQTQAPIIEADYFTMRALSDIQGKGAFKTIFGGLYSEHLGLKTLKKNKGQTDEDALLRKLGIVNLDSTKTAVQIFDELRSDRRAAIFHSKVTGRPRRIDWFPTLSASPEDVAVLFVTNDIGARDIDLGNHALFDLHNAKFLAREWIWRGVNGLDRYALSKVEDGSLQPLAPQDIANDSTVPSPYPPELQSAESCLACHGKHEGYQPFRNDVQVMFRSRAKIFGQVLDLKKGFADIFNKLARLEQLYRGDGADLLRMARTANARGVLKVTGPWVKSKDQADVVTIAYAHVVHMSRRHKYELIDAQAACRELGFEVGKDKAVDFLIKLLPPVKALVGDLAPESVVIWGLLSGIEVTRFDWALLYSFASARSQNTLAKGLQKQGSRPMERQPSVMAQTPTNADDILKRLDNTLKEKK